MLSRGLPDPRLATHGLEAWGHQTLGGSALPARERPFQGLLARDPFTQGPDGGLELLGRVRAHWKRRG